VEATTGIGFRNQGPLSCPLQAAQQERGDTPYLNPISKKKNQNPQTNKKTKQNPSCGFKLPTSPSLKGTLSLSLLHAVPSVHTHTEASP